MFALIPYFDIPIYSLGPVDLDPWALLVCAGFIVGLEVARARGIKLGLDTRDVVDGAVVTVGMGFLGGHVMHILAYHPDILEKEGPVTLLKVWAGLSSTGGLLGAIVGSVVFYTLIRRRPYWIHADSIMFGFPFAWVFGRLGCFAAHDHIGRLTDFPLAVDFPGGARHDLGLYEALWTAVIAGTFLALREKRLRHGFFLALFALMYAPIRFVLDFLRKSPEEGGDARYAGLTPAQYGMIGLTLVGAAIVLWLLKSPPPAAPGSGAEPGEGGGS